LLHPTWSQKPSKKGAAAPPSRWQRFVWQELHLLRHHQLEMKELGPMRQLGMMKRHRSPEEEGEGFLPSGVCSSGREVGNLSPKKNKQRRRQQSNCCKPPLIPRL